MRLEQELLRAAPPLDTAQQHSCPWVQNRHPTGLVAMHIDPHPTFDDVDVADPSRSNLLAAQPSAGGQPENCLGVAATLQGWSSSGPTVNPRQLVGRKRSP